MSRPTVFVHVGCRKTGTSFLQKAVYGSAEALEAQGIALPLPGRAAHYQVVAALREIVEGQPVPPDARRVIDDLAARVGATTLDRAVMTHEALAPSEPAQVRALMAALDGCDVHVVITARDLARQIPSEWQQTLKDRAVLPYADFCREVVEGQSAAATEFWSRQDVVEVARRWSVDLPPDRVHIVPVPPPGSPPEQLLDMFCGLIGCDPASLSEPAGFNPSLGAEQAEVLRRVNVALGSQLSNIRVKRGYRDVVRVGLAKGVLSQQEGTPLRLPARPAGLVPRAVPHAGRRARGPRLRRGRQPRAPRPCHRHTGRERTGPRGHRRPGRRGGDPGAGRAGVPAAPRAGGAATGGRGAARAPRTAAAGPPPGLLTRVRGRASRLTRRARNR